MKKLLCCPECGSDELIWRAWVDENNNYAGEGDNYAICQNDDCGVCNDVVKPVLKSDGDRVK